MICSSCRSSTFARTFWSNFPKVPLLFLCSTNATSLSRLSQLQRLLHWVRRADVPQVGDAGRQREPHRDAARRAALHGVAGRAQRRAQPAHVTAHLRQCSPPDFLFLYKQRSLSWVPMIAVKFYTMNSTYCGNTELGRKQWRFPKTSSSQERGRKRKQNNAGMDKRKQRTPVPTFGCNNRYSTRHSRRYGTVVMMVSCDEVDDVGCCSCARAAASTSSSTWNWNRSKRTASAACSRPAD